LVLLLVLVLIIPYGLRGQEHEPIRVDDDQELLQLAQQEGWPGSGTEEDPIVIEGLDIRPERGPGIYLGNVSLWVLVKECSVEGASPQDDRFFRGAGILLYNSSHVRILDCSLRGNDEGVYAKFSAFAIDDSNIEGSDSGGIVSYGSEFTVENTTLSDNDVGVDALQSRTKVMNCVIRGSHDGVYASGGNVVIRGSRIMDVESSGIELYEVDGPLIEENYIEGGHEGIGLYRSSNGTIANNTVIGGFFGIFLFKSKGNLVVGNWVEGCDEGISVDYHGNGNEIVLNALVGNGYGVVLHSDTSGNLVHRNAFVHNAGSGDHYDPAHVQALDSSGHNLWNDSEMGNYWRDWAMNNDTNDGDSDGIVDYPYRIEGYGIDYLPLKESPVGEIPEFEL